MNTLYVIENKELRIVRKVANAAEADKSKLHLERIFGKPFTVKEYLDVWDMTNDL